MHSFRGKRKLESPSCPLCPLTHFLVWVSVWVRQQFHTIEELWHKIKIPKRGTLVHQDMILSCRFPFLLDARKTIRISTRVRVKIYDGWWLTCVPRNSLGLKYRLQLDNTFGAIDSDCYGSKNEGHIIAQLTNDSKAGRSIHMNRRDKFMQDLYPIWHHIFRYCKSISFWSW